MSSAGLRELGTFDSPLKIFLSEIFSRSRDAFCTCGDCLRDDGSETKDVFGEGEISFEC